MKPFFTLFPGFLFFFTVNVFAQDSNLVRFAYGFERLNDKEVLLTIRAHVNGGHKLYSVNKVSDDVLFSTVIFDSTVNSLLKGTLNEKGSIRSEKDTSIGGVEVKYTSDSLVWQQKAALPDTVTKSFDGKIAYLVKDGNEYKSGEQEFTITVKPGSTTVGPSMTRKAVQCGHFSWAAFWQG